MSAKQLGEMMTCKSLDEGMELHIGQRLLHHCCGLLKYGGHVATIVGTVIAAHESAVGYLVRQVRDLQSEVRELRARPSQNSHSDLAEILATGRTLLYLLPEGQSFNGIIGTNINNRAIGNVKVPSSKFIHFFPEHLKKLILFCFILAVSDVIGKFWKYQERRSQSLSQKKAD